MLAKMSLDYAKMFESIYTTIRGLGNSIEWYSHPQSLLEAAVTACRQTREHCCNKDEPRVKGATRTTRGSKRGKK